MLEENWDAVQVFSRCRQQYAVSMSGAFALGFNALEIEAGCRLVGVAPDQWPEISRHVQEMGATAAALLNERRGA